MSEKKSKTISVRTTPQLNFQFAAGRYGTLFLDGLKNHKIYASRCDDCERTVVPPRVACTGCFGRMEKIVELPPRGKLLLFTQVTFPFLDPSTGVQRPIPYCYGMVQFEGSDNTFQYFIDEKDPTKLHAGQAVEAAFSEEKKGTIADLEPFKPVPAEVK